MKYLGFFFSLLVAASLLPAMTTDAEAKRLGGGRSFGSKPAYQRSATPTNPGGAPRSAAQQRNVQQRAALASRGGLWGMLGGLALGGMLGALFFGGAFEGLNFLDILLFGGIAYLLYRMFVARRHGPGVSSASVPATRSDGHQRSAVAAAPSTPQWGLDSPEMKRKFDPDQGSGGSVAGTEAGGRDIEVPEGVDCKAFLEGAERAYRTLQAAWDAEDLETLRGLSSEGVFEELRTQLAERQGRNETVVLSLDADLLEMRRVGDQLQASVMFDAYIREVGENIGDGDRGHQAREVWHFVRASDAARPTWFLDGIQQLEE